MKKIICWFKGHLRGKTYFENRHWYIQCKRCGYETNYQSPYVRLISEEISLGFDGN